MLWPRAMTQPFTPERLAALSAEDLAAYLFSELDEDPEGEGHAARALCAEAARRGLSHDQLLALWNAQHEVG